ncbi:MAG: hypothetical protein ICV72_02100 [Aldersonia sp.]|nr:hypothetical protein [Aldersonia sp.]
MTLLARGCKPVLAGRNADALDNLAAELRGLPTATADAGEPRSVRTLVERGDMSFAGTGGGFRADGASNWLRKHRIGAP